MPDSLLMVAEPSPVDAPPLPNASNVAAAAAAYFEKRLELAGPKATLDGVRSELPHYSVQHFECHARADVLQPLESGLLLADDQSLSLRDLLASETPGTRISVLSACETAVVGAKLPDEVLSLPTGLLQAGTAGVVASMWRVTDRSTALLMFRFYELWLKEKLAPREAIRHAMRWLRDSSNGDLVAYLERFTGGAMALSLVTPATSLWTELAFEPPETRDYEHPRYWAAFAYTGA
jgi:CHAT domain-containing protein